MKKELQVRIVGQERDHAIILSWNDSGTSGTVRGDTPSDPQLAEKGQKCEVNEILCTYQCQARGGGGILTFSEKIIIIPTPGGKLAETNGLLLFCSIKLKDEMHDVRSKSPPWGYTPQSNSRGCPTPPPPLGLDIDRCIIPYISRHSQSIISIIDNIR